MVWRTFFLPLINTELAKNVGQFPYHAALLGYDAGIIAYTGEPMPLLKNFQKLKNMPVSKKFGELLDASLYLLRHGRAIDILCGYHVKGKTLIPIMIYKMVNPKGKVWLDLDWHMGWAMSYEKRKHGTIPQRLQFAYQKWILRHCCSLVSSPATTCVQKAKEIYHLSERQARYIPLGYIEARYSYPYTDKEPIFLCVGRLGTFQKNIELLVNAFCKTYHLHDWKLVLIGSAERKFLKFLDRAKKSISDTTERISYLGEINDRECLASWYARSSVFVLPSRYESFGIVLCEALAQGCYLLGSDSIDSWGDITGDDLEIGATFHNNNVASLCNSLTNIIDSPYLQAQYCEKRAAYAKQHFTYPQIIKKVFKYLEETEVLPKSQT